MSWCLDEKPETPLIYIAYVTGIIKQSTDSFAGLPINVRWPDNANLKSKLKNDGSKSQTVNLN